MIKSIKAIMRQDREQYRVPRRVQDVIPIQAVWPDGIFKVGNKFSKTYRFSDINYMVASREDKEGMFLTYSELLNSLDSAATTKPGKQGIPMVNYGIFIAYVNGILRRSLELFPSVYDVLS